MNMQQMLAQAQRMQRELAKAKAALAEKEFKVAKGGMVEVTLLGDRSVSAINIDEAALESDNKEMLEETLEMAINEALEQINQANEELEEKVTGRTNLF